MVMLLKNACVYVLFILIFPLCILGCSNQDSVEFQNSQASISSEVALKSPSASAILPYPKLSEYVLSDRLLQLLKKQPLLGVGCQLESSDTLDFRVITADMNAAGLDELLRHSQMSISVMSPLWVVDDAGLSYFSSIVANGASVNVLVPALSVFPSASEFSAYARHREAILEAGIGLSEFFDVPEAMSQVAEAKASTVAKTKVVRKRHHRQTRRIFELGDSEPDTPASSVYLIDERYMFCGRIEVGGDDSRIQLAEGVILNDAERIAKMLELYKNIQENAAYSLGLVTSSAGGRSHKSSQPKVKTHLRWTKAAASSTPEYFDQDPSSGWWQRFGVSFYRIMPAQQSL